MTHSTDSDSLDPDRLADRFNAANLPKEHWTHHAHLAVGLWHVDSFGPDEAVARLRIGIRRLNDFHGTPNTATSGYHETITVAQVRLIAGFLSRCTAGTTRAERLAQLLDTPLADRSVLLRFYSRERLMSERARAEWIEPDLSPISADVVLEPAVE